MSERAQRRDAWRALTPPRPTRAGQIVPILVRHAIPIAGMLWFGWSAIQFLLLTVFNLGLSIANIGLTGVTAATLRGAPGEAPARMDIGQWLNLIAACTFIALLLTALGCWPIFIIAARGLATLRDPDLWWSALAMELALIPALHAEICDKLRSPMSLEQLKARDQPRVGSAFAGIGLSMLLSGWAAGFGSYATVLLVIAFTALSLVRELRPDLVHEAIRPKDMPPAR